jgi:transposase
MPALALLLADEGDGHSCLKDAEITKITGLSSSTLERLRKRCCDVGPLAALERKPRATPPREIKITGDIEARIIQLACSDAPEGHVRWTLHLLAKQLVEIEVVENISHTSVSTVLKKASSSHGKRNAGVFRLSKTPLL